MENKEMTNNVQNGNVQAQPQIIIAQSPKNMGIALLLAFLFGPIGLCYSTVKGGVIMFLISLVVILVTFGFGVLIMWIPCVIWAYIATNNYNKELMTTGRIPQ